MVRNESVLDEVRLISAGGMLFAAVLFLPLCDIRPASFFVLLVWSLLHPFSDLHTEPLKFQYSV